MKAFSVAVAVVLVLACMFILESTAVPFSEVCLILQYQPTTKMCASVLEVGHDSFVPNVFAGANGGGWKH